MDKPWMTEGGPNRGTTLFGVVCLAGAATLVGWNWTLGREARQGPTEIQATALVEAEGLGGLPGWVKFKPTKVIDTGVRRFETYKGMKVATYKYRLVQIGDRFLVAESRLGESTIGTVSGHLEKWPAGAREDVVPEIYSKFAFCRGKLLPFQIDTHTEHDAGAFWIWVAAGMCCFFGIGLVVTGVYGWYDGDPRRERGAPDGLGRRWAPAGGPVAGR